jgi:hypothetical protein
MSVEVNMRPGSSRTGDVGGAFGLVCVLEFLEAAFVSFQVPIRFRVLRDHIDRAGAFDSFG